MAPVAYAAVSLHFFPKEPQFPFKAQVATCSRKTMYFQRVSIHLENSVSTLLTSKDIQICYSVLDNVTGERSPLPSLFILGHFTI